MNFNFLTQSRFNRTPRLPPPPTPLKQCCVTGKLIVDGKINIVQGGGGGFPQNCPWQLLRCEGVPILMTTIIGPDSL